MGKWLRFSVVLRLYEADFIVLGTVCVGDVLLMRGSGRISDIGNAGGLMGHVLVVRLA